MLLCVITDSEGKEMPVKCEKAGKIIEVRKRPGDSVVKGYGHNPFLYYLLHDLDERYS